MFFGTVIICAITFIISEMLNHTCRQMVCTWPQKVSTWIFSSSWANKIAVMKWVTTYTFIGSELKPKSLKQGSFRLQPNRFLHYHRWQYGIFMRAYMVTFVLLWSNWLFARFARQHYMLIQLKWPDSWVLQSESSGQVPQTHGRWLFEEWD